MKRFNLVVLWCVLHTAMAAEDPDCIYEQLLKMTAQSEARERRDVIEEEKFFDLPSDSRNDDSNNAPWLPHPLPPENPTTKISITKEVHPYKDKNPPTQASRQTTESYTDKPTGRGARASNENWIKLPYPARDQPENDVLTPPQPSGELINSRMPRVNFVTQNKQLETSESRNDKESIHRPARTDDNIRTEFVRPGEEDRNNLYKQGVYPRQALYYPEESRRYNIDDRYYPSEELYRRDPYYDLYDRRRYHGYSPYGPRVDRLDEINDNFVPRKPKRIIYYAHLPEVVRTPPSVDLRYRYSDPYRRYDDDYMARTGRYDYRFRNRYPYAPLRKEERNYRDLSGAATQQKDKKVEEKITPTPILPKKEEHQMNKNPATVTRNVPFVRTKIINSHQYHDGPELLYDPLHYKGFDDTIRPDDTFVRYEEPAFRSLNDPYHRSF